MTNRVRVITGCVAVVAAAMLLSTQVMSQEKTKPEATAEQQMDEMMAQWAAMNAKGAEHKKFETMVGTWVTETKMWMAPNSEPMASKGEAKFRLILDGRYIEQSFKGEMMGESFEGIGIEGYDNFKKKFVSIWMDNSSTGFFMSEGTADKTGKVTTYLGKMDDPMTGQKNKIVKSVAREISKDKVVFDMYDTTPDGKEFKTMEITYMRKKVNQ